jgi:hypothetical protein
MKTRQLLLALLIAIVAVNTVACKKNNDPDLFIEGTVVTESGFSSVSFMLVQVNEKYPIGGSMDFTEDMRRCYTFDRVGLYRNLIQVQRPGTINFPDRNDKYTVGNTISFSYRAFNPESDRELFKGISFLGTASYNSIQKVSEDGCSSFPNVPIYVITDYKILK